MRSVCNRPNELALKEVELPGSSRSDPPSGRCVALLTGVRGQRGRRARGRGAGYKAAAQPGTSVCLSFLSSGRSEAQRACNARALGACALCPFSLFQPAPRGTVGAPSQRATPTRRAPPGAVGTLPPPPGRPPVPGLLWAHYMPALFADSGPNKGIGVPGTECLLVGLVGYQSKSAVHGRTQQSGRVRGQLGSTLSRRAPCLQQP